LATIMKIVLKTILGVLLTSCFASKNIIRKDNESFHDDIKAKIIVKSVDRFSVELYDIYRFQFVNESKNGIILKLKTDTTAIPFDKSIEIELCDIGEFKTIFRESDTTYIGDVPLVYGEQEGLEDNNDTISYRGHFMLNGIIVGENGEIVLDFGNNATEPVFEICKN